MNSSESSISIQISLRVVGPTIARTSELLGLEPDRAIEAGEPRNRGEGVYSRNVWLLEGSCEFSELSSTLGALLSRLRSTPDRIAKLRGEAEIFEVLVGLFPSDDNVVFSLEGDVVVVLARFGIPLHFDLYPLGR